LLAEQQLIPTGELSQFLSSQAGQPPWFAVGLVPFAPPPPRQVPDAGRGASAVPAMAEMREAFSHGCELPIVGLYTAVLPISCSWLLLERCFLITGAELDTSS
jgi:hypothetical protein